MRLAALVVSAALVLFSSPASADQTSRPVRVLVPAGTAIPVHVTGQVSSQTAHAGDKIQLQVAKDVVVNGMVVVRADSDGEGEISDVNHAEGNGHSGALELHFNWVHSVDGGKIALSQTSQKQAEDDRTGAKSTATIIGVATLGIGGLFGHNFAHGKEVTIDAKKILNAFVNDNVHVEANARAAEERYDR